MASVPATASETLHDYGLESSFNVHSTYYRLFSIAYFYRSDESTHSVKALKDGNQLSISSGLIHSVTLIRMYLRLIEENQIVILKYLEINLSS